MYNFKNVTLLITHYKRSRSLENLLNYFKGINCDFGEVIISDDGSPAEHIEFIENVLKNNFNFKFIKTEVNKGLGNNINKGQDAVTLPYTLYVQEDFEPQKNFPAILQDSLQIMDSDSSIDFIRYFAHYIFPYVKDYAHNKDFYEMSIPFPGYDYQKIYLYSDTPHLRRSNFFKKFGRYREGIAGDRTEYWMCISTLANKGKGLLHKKFKEIFLHENLEQEPSTMVRSKLTLSNNKMISILRDGYRQMKYNSDIYLFKFKRRS